MKFRLIVSQYAVFETVRDLTYVEFFQLVFKIYLNHRDDRQNFLAQLSNNNNFKVKGMLPNATDNGTLVIKDFPALSTMHILFNQKQIVMTDSNTDFFCDLEKKYVTVTLFYKDRAELTRYKISNIKPVIEIYQAFKPEIVKEEINTLSEYTQEEEFQYSDSDFAADVTTVNSEISLEDMLPPEEVLTNKAAARISKINSIAEKTVDLNPQVSSQAIPLSDDVDINKIAEELAKIA